MVPEHGTSGTRPQRVLKGFLGILTGSALAQVLALAATPILSRLYTPEDAAHYALLMGVGAVLAAFATLKFDLAVPIPEALAESRRLFWMAVLAPLLVLPVTGLLAGLLSIGGVWRSESLDSIDYVALAVFVFFLSVFTSASQLAIRLRSYGILGRIPVIQMLGTLVAQIALGSLAFSRGLFVGGLVGRSLGIAKLMRSCEVRLSQVPSPSEARALCRRYWRFPVIFAPASVVEVLGSNLAALMLPALFGFGPAGLFAMAVRVTAVPSAVVSQSAGQVFLGEFARAEGRPASLRIFLRWSVALLLIGLSVTGAVWVLAPLVLPPVLGNGWSGTAQLAQYAGLMAGAAIVGSPVQHVWTVRQRGVMQFAWNLIRLITTAGVIWSGAQSDHSLAQVVEALAWATCAVYALAWVGCLYAAGRIRTAR